MAAKKKATKKPAVKKKKKTTKKVISKIKKPTRKSSIDDQYTMDPEF